MEQFEVQTINSKETNKSNAYFHVEYLKAKDEILGIKKRNIAISENLKNAISECLLVHHTDMFFTYIFRYIIFIEYEEREQNLSIDIKVILEKYKKICAYVLKEICNVKTEELSKVSPADIRNCQGNYSGLINNGVLYGDVIATYVIYRTTIKEIILNELNDEEHFYPKFIQLCMMEGFDIAINRMEINIDSKEYFGHELIKTRNLITIKIFPTPFGFLMKNSLAELAKEGKLIDKLDTYFANKNIFRIHDDVLKQKLRTNLIYKQKDEEGIFYYKRRNQSDDDYAPFGEQDRQAPFYALLMQGQMNLTLSKEE